MNFIRKALNFIVKYLPSPRVIYDADGITTYLSRYYLKGKPRMPDGSSPFDQYGAPRKGAVFPDGIGVYLHRFHSSDRDKQLHSHPFAWSFSVVLSGGYREQRRKGNHTIWRNVLPFHLNWIDKDTFHRVELLEEDAWTLFIVGAKVDTWHFWDESTNSLIPWREFLKHQKKVNSLSLGDDK